MGVRERSAGGEGVQEKRLLCITPKTHLALAAAPLPRHQLPGHVLEGVDGLRYRSMCW